MSTTFYVYAGPNICFDDEIDYRWQDRIWKMLEDTGSRLWLAQTEEGVFRLIADEEVPGIERQLKWSRDSDSSIVDFRKGLRGIEYEMGMFLTHFQTEIDALHVLFEGEGLRGLLCWSILAYSY